MRDVQQTQTVPARSQPARASRGSARRPLTAAAALAAMALLPLAACEHDSYMNPSITGRWENTPTIVPVLERLSAVEGPVGGNAAEYSPITQADLIPEADAYRIDAGDGLEVLVNELFSPNIQERYERLVDPRGMIELPNVPSVYVAGMTADEASQAISRAYKARRILTDPIIAVSVPARRKQTFHLMGGVNAPGTYGIPRPDFRLLEAITQGGRFTEYTQWVYVIRATPLSDRAAGRVRPLGAMEPEAVIPAGPAKVVDAPAGMTPARPRESVIDLIDSLGAPDKNSTKPAIYPSMYATQDGAAPVPVIDIDAVSRNTTTTTTTTTAAPVVNRVSDSGSMMTSTGGSRWVFVDGQWVAAGSRIGGGTAGGGATSAARGVNVNPAADIISQRVIRVPMDALLSGSAMHNIVVRPGDVIRIPSPTEGLVYVEGQVARPGPYALPSVGRLTLVRAIVAAGGLGEQAIPERMEITRFVGPDRQAIVRLNYRAIKEGTQPDLFLREGDVINVGTNFWALPLAVIRNGFRASYGFGFILDR
ncbi:MAG: polysaccharide biosynthesis/export family protein, partial [Phycisphaerales bacterium]|nr:polysaccharide biosynthesis/export family protein [Phycisphaerales bacterium]